MSDSDDYQSDMIFNRNADRDIDRLFDSSGALAGSVDPLGGLFESLRTAANIELDEDTVAGFVAAATATSAAAARERVPGPVAAVSSTSKRGSVMGSLRRRATTAAAAAALFIGATTGIAVAADQSKPGDALYGVDRALEVVGIGDGDGPERIVEARALLDAGEPSRGLRHAAEAVENDGADPSPASSALLQAAERVAAVGSTESDATLEQVAGLLSYLASDAEDFSGRRVAELAREIGRSHGDRPDTPADDGSTGRPESPGRSDSSPGRSNPPKTRP